jgi:hypothetical protein
MIRCFGVADVHILGVSGSSPRWEIGYPVCLSACLIDIDISHGIILPNVYLTIINEQFHLLEVRTNVSAEPAIYIYKATVGRAIAQTVSRPLPTVAKRV